MKAEMKEYESGVRVWVHDEDQAGTVVKDHGSFRNWDDGVTVRLDDGVVVVCAHSQVERAVNIADVEVVDE